MNWETQIFDGLVAIVKAGGVYAILGILVWGILPVIKISVIGGLIFAGVTKIFKTLSNLYLLRIYNKSKTVTLLSKNVSKQLEDHIKNWRTESEKVTQELLKSVEDLKKQSEGIAKGEPATKNS